MADGVDDDMMCESFESILSPLSCSCLVPCLVEPQVNTFRISSVPLPSTSTATIAVSKNISSNSADADGRS